jgi:hypothetical protein
MTDSRRNDLVVRVTRLALTDALESGQTSDERMVDAAMFAADDMLEFVFACLDDASCDMLGELLLDRVAVFEEQAA